MIKHRQPKGQIALVLVLVMTVVSALAVSMASRSTVDSKIQQVDNEGLQAQILAQTGLEDLIINPGQTTTSPNPLFFAETVSVGSDSFETGRINSGSTTELNLKDADFDSLTGFRVYWKPDVGSEGKQPAVLISLVRSNRSITDYAYDYTGSNGFSAAENGSVEGYEKRTPVIGLTDDISLVRITALGSATLMKVVPVGLSGALFPPQLKSIRSTGSVPSETSTVKYGLQYDESAVDMVPSVFDYALFSGGTIVQ